MPPTLAPGPTPERQPRRPAEHGHSASGPKRSASASAISASSWNRPDTPSSPARADCTAWMISTGSRSRRASSSHQRPRRRVNDLHALNFAATSSSSSSARRWPACSCAGYSAAQHVREADGDQHAGERAHQVHPVAGPVAAGQSRAEGAGRVHRHAADRGGPQAGQGDVAARGDNLALVDVLGQLGLGGQGPLVSVILGTAAATCRLRSTRCPSPTSSQPGIAASAAGGSSSGPER